MVLCVKCRAKVTMRYCVQCGTESVATAAAQRAISPPVAAAGQGSGYINRATTCWPWARANPALEAYDQAGSGESHTVYAQTGGGESTGVVARVWKESMRWHEPAMLELLQGAKTGHWIWHVFPTHVRHAAGSKPDSAMCSLAEASEYLSHPQLRRNYLEVSSGTGCFIGGAGTAYTNKCSCAHAHTHSYSRHA